jgi:signal transduction histidine kinase
MSRLLARIVRPFLPAALRRTEVLARELERARVEGREVLIDPGESELHRAVAERVLETRLARERAKDAARAADEAEQYQREFLLAMSHEIRTPLNAIHGFARVLLDEIDGPLSEEERLDVESIHEAGEHLMDLLRDFLSLVADRASGAGLQSAPFSGAELVAEVARLGRGLARGSAVEVVVDEAPEDVVFLGDRAKIRQALANLVSNAVKFTPEGQVLLGMSRVDGRRGAIRVEDSGPGFDPAIAGSSRGEFIQAKDEPARARGSGLGLVIADRIARLSGGELRITSRLGAGTTVEMELPCADEVARS